MENTKETSVINELTAIYGTIQETNEPLIKKSMEVYNNLKENDYKTKADILRLINFLIDINMRAREETSKLYK